MSINDFDGIYKINRIALIDKAGRYIQYYNSNLHPNESNIMDFSNADFNVSVDVPDKLPPELISISVNKSTITPNDLDNNNN